MTPPLRTFARRGEILRRCALGALVLLVAACATRTPAPVQERRPPAPPQAATTPAPPAAAPAASDARPQTYTVKRGDTLQAIALDHGLDYRELAAWNNIENPNLIRVGQVLRVLPPGETGGETTASGVTTTPLRAGAPIVAGDARPPASPPATPLAVPGPRNSDNYKSQPKALKEAYSEQALRDAQKAAAAPAPAPAAVDATPAPAAPAVVARADPAPSPPVAIPPRPDAKPAGSDDGGDRIDWLWPATGKLVTGFSDTANLKGIDIAGKAGQPVVASAAGKVVYAGSGLRGYGKLVIVKHSDTFLSAYAHNSEILVKEGQQVTRGQKIAEMGNSDSDQVKLHFEIRRQGKPVDPLKFLPPA